MDDARSSRGPVLAVVMLMLVLPVTAYITSYVLLTDRDEFATDFAVGPSIVIRRVSQEWMIPFFKPLAAIESLTLRERIVLMVPNEEGWISYPPLN